MAGGAWKEQTKIRPGAYMNFKGVSKPQSVVGTRGVVTFPSPMSWGAEVTELLSTDLMDGKSLEKIGYTYSDEEAQLFREALKGAYKAIIYRLDVGGVGASATIGELNVAAKYPGIVGNSIGVSVISSGTRFEVVTLFRGVEKDRQVVEGIEGLVDNEWVEFSGTGELTATAGTMLTGGTNGSVSESRYTDYLTAAKKFYWNTMGIPQSVSENTKKQIADYIKTLRDDIGKKVQVVLNNFSGDHEGIISTLAQGYKTKEEIVAPDTFVAYVAGICAGAELGKSNTYREIEGATEIISPLSDEDIEKALKAGMFVLSTRQDGIIVIEQDINTLRTYSSDKNYSFSLNQIIRTLDDINNQVSLMFETSYIGKVNNDESGRNVFKADLILYLDTLQSLGVIEDFDSGEDINIEKGTAVNAVVVELNIKPVGAIEKLYMSVLVG